MTAPQTTPVVVYRLGVCDTCGALSSLDDSNGSQGGGPCNLVRGSVRSYPDPCAGTVVAAVLSQAAPGE